MSCGRPLTPSRLLFPVKEKDYASDPFLEAEWKSFENALESAYLFTIFGYGVPATDAKAVEIMKQAWQRPGQREVEEVEIIDIRGREELRARWDPFIVRSHYRIEESFDKSMVARLPRRSCEAIWNQFMMLRVSEEYPLPRCTVSEAQELVRPLLAAELMRQLRP